MGIGKRIKEAREALKLTQDELAKMVGVTKAAIGNYENGVSHPKEPVLYRLFEALKCDANFLFQDELIRYDNSPDKNENTINLQAVENETNEAIMKFLNKLDFLMEQRKINKNILSNESGIPYATIVGFYKKGYENTKLSTLQKLCSYFDVTLDFLVRDDIFDVNFGKTDTGFTNREQRIIAAYRSHPEMHEAVHKILGIEFADDLTSDFQHLA